MTDDRAHRLELRHRLNVPRQEAFSWWSDAGRLQRWSGCKGATHCEVVMDFRVGGTFQQTMEIACRGTFSFRGTYEEIVFPERIVWRAHFGPMSTKVSVTFVDLGDQTDVLLVQEGFPSAEAVKTVAQGTEESFAALIAILNRASTAIEGRA